MTVNPSAAPKGTRTFAHRFGGNSISKTRPGSLPAFHPSHGSTIGASKAIFNWRYLPAPLEPRHKKENSACDAPRLSITRVAGPAKVPRPGGVGIASQGPSILPLWRRRRRRRAVSREKGAERQRPSQPRVPCWWGIGGGWGVGRAPARRRARAGPAVAGLSSGGGGGCLLMSDREPAARRRTETVV